MLRLRTHARSACALARAIALGCAVAMSGLTQTMARVDSIPCVGSDHRKWTDCVGEQFGINWSYVGQFVNGRPEGNGTLRYQSGTTYVGPFKAGQPHGQGTYTFANGDHYVGEVRQGALTGIGTLRSAAGHTYVGAIRNGAPDGEGEYSFANGDHYLGEIRQGALTGKGTFRFANGDVYLGTLNGGMPHGVGTLIYRSGNRYVGEFSRGIRTGHGILTFVNGDEYSGSLANDTPEGNGTLTFADGTRYRGIFEKGQFSGHGQLTFSSGDSYLGEFKKQTFWGEGTYLYADGTKYVGQFEDGFRLFQGVVAFPSGDSYVGELRNGRPHGEGIYLGTDGGSTFHVASEEVEHAVGFSDLHSAEEASAKQSSEDPAGQSAVVAAQLASTAVAARPVLEEIRKLRQDWLRLAETKLQQEQALATERFNGERRKIEEERAQLDVEKNRIAQQLQQQKDELATELADLERRKRQEERAREEIRVAENKLRQNEELVVAGFTKERLRLEDERSRLEAERIRLQQEMQAQGVNPTIEDKRRRVALVIGNAKYDRAPLHNPENDARDLTRALTAIGFRVIEYRNLDLKQMREAVRKFATELSVGDVALFYFSGHGAESGGKNYLIPVKEDITSGEEIPSSSVDAELVLAKMTGAGAELSIMILDACRSNPYLGSRASFGGLTPMQAAKGSLIAYSTAPGMTAADGSDANSPYTKHLVRAVSLRGIPMERMFKEVRAAVVKETADKQVPWETSSVIGEFYFRP